VLALVAILGWGLWWHFTQTPPQTAEPPVTAQAKPEPVVPDRSVEFETVTDRTPMSFRDSSAYALLLDRARGKDAAELAAASRRDVVLAHLWQTPELYRGIPMHLAGSAQRVLRYPSQLSQSGWLHEAWIFTPEAPKVPYVCVFEDAPQGLPIGPSVSERVVFNGYFLKLMKYQAADVARGAPVLVGRIGWAPPAAASGVLERGTLRWTLLALGVLFFISLVRWALPLRRLFATPARRRASSTLEHPREIDPAALDSWVQSVAREDSGAADGDPGS
jgi:hypothetical protein